MSFNGQYYNIEGEKYPRVTSILGVLDKPFLSRWQLNIMGDCIKSDYITLLKNGSDIDIDLLIDKAKRHPNIVRDAAATYGSYIHNVFERKFKNESLDDIIKNDTKLTPLIDSIDEWITAHSIEPIAVEMQLVSKKHKYAGTCDLVCWHTTEGKPRALAIIDMKTGKGTYDTHRLQLSAYAMAYEEMTGQRPDIAFLIHVRDDKLTETMHIHYHKIPQYFEIFLNVYKLWEWRRNNK